VRWTATSNEIDSGAGLVCSLESILLGCCSDPQAPLQEIVVGEVDVEPWSDDQEIRIDRIVGNITTEVMLVWAEDPALAVQTLQPLIRYGLTVVEEGDAPALNLWSEDDLAQIEWMWLWQGTTDTGRTASTGGGDTVSAQWVTQSVDIRNKRKLGFRDKLYLYGQWCWPTGLGAEPDVTGVLCVPLLRTIMVGR